MRRFILLFVLIMLTITCYVAALSARRDVADRNDRPQWLTNPQSRYPQGMYLVAIGEGDNRSRAEADAASNIARIFETRVETEQLVRERYAEIVSEQDFTYETFTEIDRRVNLSATQTLYNIQYAESYTDERGRVYVLAYIDRHRTADIYMDMIANHNRTIVSFLNRAADSDNNLHRFAYKSAASVISSTNETLLDQLQIIAPDYKAMIQLDYDHNELLLETRKLANNLRFRIELENDQNNRIHSMLAGLLTGHGFVVDDNGEIIIKGDVMIEDIDLPRQEKFVRWHLNLRMQDQSGSNVLTHSQRGREGHLSQSEAVARAYRAMDNEITKDFNRKLFSFFDNLVK